jgi:hypothetical protein
MCNKISGAYSGLGRGEDKDKDKNKDENKDKDEGCSLGRRPKRFAKTRTGVTWHGGV